jgi:hypothetical protein
MSKTLPTQLSPINPELRAFLEVQAALHDGDYFAVLEEGQPVVFYTKRDGEWFGFVDRPDATPEA